MLIVSIVLFGISAFCYSYAYENTEMSFSLIRTYPYQIYVIPLLSTGFVLMSIASVSYSKKSKKQLLSKY